MLHTISRRTFLGTAAIPLACTTQPAFNVGGRRTVTPTAVGSLNAFDSVRIAVESMARGLAPVDAAVAGINPVEDDPNDQSVGYGGLPNEHGVVELDSCVMDGPTGLAGAVASLRNIKNPSRVALEVMRRTDHVLLVGEGALRFARALGFREQDLLTDASRQRWLEWKRNLSADDDWVSPKDNDRPAARPTGTIHVSCINEHGDLGACTSTSGLAFKIPGRVGDSPLIGCGLFTDNDHGSAGSTGRGEAVILSNGSSFIVNLLAGGMHPKDACLAACQRITRLNRIARLRGTDGRPNFQVNFYAVDKKGRVGAASIYPNRFAFFGSNGAEEADTAHLFERSK